MIEKRSVLITATALALVAFSLVIGISAAVMPLILFFQFIIAFGIILVAVYYPKTLFHFVIFLSMFGGMTINGHSSGDLLNLLTGGAFIVAVVQMLHRRIFPVRLILSVMLFFMVIVISTLINGQSLSETIPFMMWGILLFVGIPYLHNSKDFTDFATTYIIASVMLALIIISVQITILAGMGGLSNISTGRLHLSIFDVLGMSPQTLSVQMSMGIPFVFALYSYYKRQGNIRFLTSGMICALTLLTLGNLVTLSISGFASLIFSYMLSSQILRPTKSLRTVFVPAIILAIAIIIFLPSFEQRFDDQIYRVATEGVLYAGSGRGGIFLAALNTIRQSWLFGFGPNREVSTEYMFTNLRLVGGFVYNGDRLEPHNVFLNIAILFGVAGLAVYLWLVFQAVIPLARNLQRLRRVGKQLDGIRTVQSAILVSIIVYFFQGMAINHTSLRSYWIVLGVGLITGLYSRPLSARKIQSRMRSRSHLSTIQEKDPFLLSDQ